jgi:hypothetical protein
MIGVVSRTRAVLTAVALLSALALSGCTDDDPEPKFAPPSSEAPTSPSSASTSAAAALSPEDTVRAWVEARNDALSSGDVGSVQALSVAECTTCEDSLDPIRQVHEDGGSFQTAGWRVVSARLKSQKGSTARVTAAITYAAGTTIPRAGAAPVSYELERHIVVVDLTRVDDEWRVRFFGYLS